MEGNPKARKVPAQERLPCARQFLGVAAFCFSTDACWRSLCALSDLQKHGSAIRVRNLFPFTGA